MFFILSPVAHASINNSYTVDPEGLNDTQLDNNDNITEITNNITINNITKDNNSVESKSISFDLKVNDYFEDEQGIAYISTDKDFRGDITFQVCNSTYHGHYYSADIFNGYGKFAMPKELSAGNYTLKVSYKGDDKFSPSTSYCFFTVKKVIDPKLNIKVSDTPYNEPVLLEINADTSFNSVVKVDLSNGDSHNVEVKDGYGSLKLYNLKVGDYSINASSVRNNNFYPGNCSASFSVIKANPNLRIVVDDYKMFYVGHAHIYADKNFTGYVTVEAGDYYDSKKDEFEVYVSNGHAQVDFRGLLSRFNVATVKFSGDDSYEADQDTTNFILYGTSYIDANFKPSLIIDKDNNLKEGKIDFSWNDPYRKDGFHSIYEVKIYDGNFQNLAEYDGYAGNGSVKFNPESKCIFTELNYVKWGDYTLHLEDVFRIFDFREISHNPPVDWDINVVDSDTHEVCETVYSPDSSTPSNHYFIYDGGDSEHVFTYSYEYGGVTYEFKKTLSFD